MDPAILKWLSDPGQGRPLARETRVVRLRAPPHTHRLELTARFDMRGQMTTCHWVVGGQGKRDCVELIVQRASPTARLIDVKYDPGCAMATNAAFERGASRRMLRAIIEAVRATHSWVREVWLMDKSFVACDAGGMETVSLGPLRVLQDGQTWYEARFGARLRAAADRTAYRAQVARLVDEPTSKLPWDAFCDVYRPRFQDDDVVRALYAAAPTYRAFVARLHAASADRPAFCRAMTGWAERLVLDFTQMGGVAQPNDAAAALRLAGHGNPNASWLRQPWYIPLVANEAYEPNVAVVSGQVQGGGGSSGSVIRRAPSESDAERRRHGLWLDDGRRHRRSATPITQSP